MAYSEKNLAIMQKNTCHLTLDYNNHQRIHHWPTYPAAFGKRAEWEEPGKSGTRGQPGQSASNRTRNPQTATAERGVGGSTARQSPRSTPGYLLREKLVYAGVCVCDKQELFNSVVSVQTKQPLVTREKYKNETKLKKKKQNRNRPYTSHTASQK